MVRIYINGENATWKRIAEEYGTLYMEDLKNDVKNEPEGTTIISEDRMIEIYK